MTKSMDIERKCKNLLGKFFQENNVSTAYLFGSYAKKNFGPLSDIDIGILFNERVRKEDFFDKKLMFTQRIARILHKSNVDIVILNEASPSLRFYAVKEGRVIFDSDSKFRYAFETRTLIAYIDTKPLREEYNKYLFKNIKEGCFL